MLSLDDNIIIELKQYVTEVINDSDNNDFYFINSLKLIKYEKILLLSPFLYV